MSPLWTAWLFVLGAAMNTAIANLLVKESRVRPAPMPGFIGSVLSPWFIGGLAFYGISVLLFSKALEKLPVSIAYPAQAGLAFAFLVVMSGIFFGETMNLAKLCGVVLILCGMFIIAR